MKPLHPSIFPSILRILPSHQPISSNPHQRLSLLTRQFTTSRSMRGKNRIYDSVRTPADLHTLLRLSSANHMPLIALFSTSFCPSCKIIAPIVREIIEQEGVGETEGGIGYAEVELDSPQNGELGMRYLITSTPTLVAFNREEAQLDTKLTSVPEMRDRQFLRLWLRNEALRGGKGDGVINGFFGTMFRIRE